MNVTIIANHIHWNDSRNINFKDESGNIYFWATRSKKFDNPNIYAIGSTHEITFKVKEKGLHYTEIKNVKLV